MVIVLLLVGGMILLHRFAVRTVGFDPSAMLALGFVVLASYTFGQLVERIGLPQITGYLVAGVALGPSTAELLPAAWQIPPFDEGLLSTSVMQQLSPLNTLAVGLIALTAGGELKIGALRKGFAAIAAILGGQLVFVMVLVGAFVFAISGVIPSIVFPGLGELDTSGVLALGAVLGTVSLASSPSATIAVINDLRARGPVTGNVLATVIFKDVVLVVLFAVVTTLAAQTLGQGGDEDQQLGLYLLRHIGGALVLGIALGFGMALYLRWVKAESLLFSVGVVYTAAFLAHQLDVEEIVLFITAGFVAANFSSEGDELLETVEKLSLPVYVVFFTIAGAQLDLLFLGTIAPFAAALVGLRILGMYLGGAVGGRIGGAPAVVSRYGWLGFVSQAGVSISLAGIIARNFGEPGQALGNLIIGGIALNQLSGPVMLKLGLAAAGEIGAAEGASEEDEEVAADAEPQPLPSPPSAKDEDAWGPALISGSTSLDDAVHTLERELDELVHEVSEDPLARFREDGLAYIRDLRREFLRHHRRITVQALNESPELSPAEALRLEQAELADKWRAIVLARAAEVLQQPTWNPNPILEAAEAITDELEDSLPAPYPEVSFPAREDDSFFTALARWVLRARRSTRRLFRRPMPPRSVELRPLARWHLWGLLPEELEPVAAVHAQAEAKLVGRTRNIFDGLVLAYDALAMDIDAARHAEDTAKARAPQQGEGEKPEAEAGDDEEAPDDDDALTMTTEALEERLRGVRRHVEQELMMAVQEVDRIVVETTRRTTRAFGTCMRGLKEDAMRVGTPDLPMRRRAASTLYNRRDDARRTLVRGVSAARDTSAALYNRLALELELLALEGRVKNALDEHATALGRDVRGRAHRQVERVQEAIEEASKRFDQVIANDVPGGELSREIRELCDPIIRVSSEAAKVAAALRDQLTDERSVTHVLDALTRAAHELTDRYRIPAGPVPETEDHLPPAIGTVDVPFREWVLARIETSLAPRLLASTREVASRVEPLAQALGELERRVAFNVELATSELSVIEDETPLPETRQLLRDMIGGALDRNRGLFAGYGEASEQWGDEVRRGVRGAVLSGLEELRGGIALGEMGRLRLQLVRDVRGRRVVRFLRDLRRSIGRSWTIASRALQEGIGETRLDRIRVRLGLPARLAEEDIGEATFTPKAPVPSIPMVYRRLFSAQALEAGDILTGRDEALGRAMAVLEGRGNGALRTVALVGPDGVGKSAFVNAVVRARKWPKVRELSLDAPATVEDIDTIFERESEGHLIVVSGLHWLRSLDAGGFAPLRRFVAGVVADGGKNAFLVRADALVWAQSSQAAPLGGGVPGGRAARSARSGGAGRRRARAAHGQRLRAGVQPGHGAREPAGGGRAAGDRASEPTAGVLLPRPARGVGGALAGRVAPLAVGGRARRRGRGLRPPRAGPDTFHLRAPAPERAAGADPLSGRAAGLDGRAGAGVTLPDRPDDGRGAARRARAPRHPGAQGDGLAHRGAPARFNLPAPARAGIRGMRRDVAQSLALSLALSIAWATAAQAQSPQGAATETTPAPTSGTQGATRTRGTSGTAGGSARPGTVRRRAPARGASPSTSAETSSAPSSAPARPGRRAPTRSAGSTASGSTSGGSGAGSSRGSTSAASGSDETTPARSPRPRRRRRRARATAGAGAATESHPTERPATSPGGEATPEAPGEPTSNEPGATPEPPAAPLLDGGVPPLDGGDGGLDGGFFDGGADASVPSDDGGLDGGVEDDAGTDGGVDAGVAEPVAPPPDVGVATPAQPERDFLGAFSEWMWEHERESRASRESRDTSTEPAPISREPADEIQLVVNDNIREWLGFALPERRVSSFGIVVLLLFSFLALVLIERLRRPLPERGLVPRALSAAHLSVRLATVVLLLMLVSRLLPSWLHPALLLTVAAVAVALGFGAVWVLLPDVVGGIVLLTEGRISRGQWIVGEGFAGTVEHVGPRVTVLRAPDGALLTVPNRRVVKSPVHATDRRWHEVEVELRAPSGAPSRAIRDAIRDAVLCSPFIPPDPRLTLSRDAREPAMWRLRVRLLDVRFAAAFEGQLLERVEELLGQHD